mgnify:CR=1 FL=1
MRKRIFFFSLTGICLLLTVLTSCQEELANRPHYAPPDWLKGSAYEVLQDEGNYTMYSRDFGPEMKQALDEAAFERNRESVTSRIGLYESRREPAVTETGEFIAVTYKAAFEREDGVALRFVFKQGDESHQLYGLWFNSPMLRS